MPDELIAGPSAEDGDTARRPSRLRAFLLSLIVLAVGTGLGTAGFLVEQSQSHWRPQVARTSDGWRISTSHGLRLGAAALGPGHIVWNAGPFTVLTSLADGQSKLLGARAFGGDLSAPATSAHYVTWMDVHYQGSNVAWVYDIQNRRRVQLAGTEDVSRSPALAGSVAVWATSRGGSRGFRVVGEDLVTGRRFAIADTPVADGLLAGGELAAWVSRLAGAEPPVITVADVRTGVRRQVAPYAQAGGRLIGFAVAGRTLVWARAAGPVVADQVMSFDIDTGATRVLAQAADLTSIAADGDLVVWAESRPDGQSVISGLRQGSGHTSTIALLDTGPPTNVYASGGLVAWRVSTLLFDNYLQTATVPAGLTADTGRRLMVAADATRRTTVTAPTTRTAKEAD